MPVPAIDISDYDYSLPEEFIAQYPLPERDQSKLLVYREGVVSATAFRRLPEQLPEGTMLVFNDTRVIHARLRFELPTGKPLEIFCLRPLAPAEYALNLSQYRAVEWECLVGGNRRWKQGVISTQIQLEGGPLSLTATRLETLNGSFRIRFEWPEEQYSFAEVLAAAGQIPLPPYLKRASEASDRERYQTLLAQIEGSVAAPTAALHFSKRVLDDLHARGIQQARLTLHVGAGTFRPVTASSLAEHRMHFERFFVPQSTVAQLLEQVRRKAPIVAVGTTSLRTLESLYWIGHQLSTGTPAEWLQDGLTLNQDLPYQAKQSVDLPDAIGAIVQAMQELNLKALRGDTQLLIAPGYEVRTIQGLITNFHQPRSTLLLLVAALVGTDWRHIYEFAQAHHFRFLSYGDSSLLWKRT